MTEDPIYNAADPKQVREKGRKDKDREKEEIADLVAILSLPEGRRYIRRLLAHCGVFRAPFVPSAQVYYDNGIRSVGVKIWGEIERADVELLITMLREGSQHSN